MTRAERVIAFIERFCVTPEGPLVGKPIRLAAFQKDFILAIYDNPRAVTRRAYLAIARKNGKTALIACLLLAHIVGPEAVRNSQIISGARSREQAALVFRLAQKMINMSPELRRITRTTSSSKSIIGLPMNVEYRAISAEAGTAHGLSLSLAILDEVGQVKGPRDDFVDAIETSQGAYEAPLLIAISTQSPTAADLFSVWLDDARAGGDPATVAHVYEADDSDDILDEATWRKANPALGLFRSMSEMQEMAERASRMPSSESTFRNLYLNQRVAVSSPLISRLVWDSCRGDVSGFEPSGLYCGLDLSATRDLTAFVALSRMYDQILVRPMFWLPEDGLREKSKADRVPYDLWRDQGFLRTVPGRAISYDYVVRDILEIFGADAFASVAFDRWRIEDFRRALEAEGVDWPLVEHGQGFRDMSPAIDALERALLAGTLVHDGSPVLEMCAANAIAVSDPAGNRKMSKDKANGRIDGMVALAMAFGALSRTATDARSVYEDMGLVAL